MGEEISMRALSTMIRKEVRVVMREELERDQARVAQAVLKIVLENMGVKKEPHERRVITAKG